MPTHSRELDLEAGFQELYETLDIDSDSEMAQTQIEIYRRVEDAIQHLGEEDKYDTPAAMEVAGNALASHYGNLMEILEDAEVLEEEFYDESIEEQLEAIESEFEDGSANSII